MVFTPPKNSPVFSITLEATPFIKGKCLGRVNPEPFQGWYWMIVPRNSADPQYHNSSTNQGFLALLLFKTTLRKRSINILRCLREKKTGSAVPQNPPNFNLNYSQANWQLEPFDFQFTHKAEVLRFCFHWSFS